MYTHHTSFPRLERKVIALESLEVNFTFHKSASDSYEVKLAHPDQANHLSLLTREISKLSLPGNTIPSASSLISPSPVNLVFLLSPFKSTDHIDIGYDEGADFVAKVGMLL